MACETAIDGKVVTQSFMVIRLYSPHSFVKRGKPGGRMTRDTNDSWANMRLTQLQVRDAEDDAGVYHINRQFLD